MYLNDIKSNTLICSFNCSFAYILICTYVQMYMFKKKSTENAHSLCLWAPLGAALVPTFCMSLRFSHWPAPTRHRLGHYGDHSGQVSDVRLSQVLVLGIQMVLFTGQGHSHWAFYTADLWKRAWLPSSLGRCGHRLRLYVFLLCRLTTQNSNSWKWKFHWKCSFLS